MNQGLLDELSYKIAYIGGTIRKTDQLTLKKMLFRTTRGKAYVHFFNLDIPLEDRMINVTDHIEKLVYIVAFEEGTYLKERIKKICQSASDIMFDL